MTFKPTEQDEQYFKRLVETRTIRHHPSEVGWQYQRLKFIAEWHPRFVSMKQLVDELYSDGSGYCSDTELWSALKEALQTSKEAGEPVDHRVEIYVEYDVLFSHCINFKQRTVTEVYQYLMKRLPKKLMENMDYFATLASRKTEGADWPEFRWVSVYYVTGGSEGYYLHVDVINKQGRDCMIVGKTLLEGKAGRNYMAKVCKKISEILEV